MWPRLFQTCRMDRPCTAYRCRSRQDCFKTKTGQLQLICSRLRKTPFLAAHLDSAFRVAAMLLPTLAGDAAADDNGSGRIVRG